MNAAPRQRPSAERFTSLSPAFHPAVASRFMSVASHMTPETAVRDSGNHTS
jgi:hypothetical protein